MKKAVCLLLVLLTALVLPGCWNNRDITELAIVVGCGVDVTPKGDIEFTVQVISPKTGSNSSASSSGGSSGGDSGLTVSTNGKTIFDAARNLISKLSKKAYYAQVQTVLIGEEAARTKGLENIWDFFERDHEFNRTFSFLVVKGGTARQVLKAHADIELLGAVELSDAVSNQAFGKNVETKAFKVSDTLGEPLAGLVTGVVTHPEEANSLCQEIEGGAVFKNGKLIGYLSNEQTRGYNFVLNKLKSTILLVDNPQEEGKLVALELVSSIASYTANVVNGKPKFRIKLQAQGNIGEEQGGADLTDAENMKMLKEEAKQRIAADIEDMMKQSQKVLNCDIIDFSDYLYKHDYKDFEKIKKNWDQLYKDAEVEVQVNFEIVRPGIIMKPAFGN